MPPRIKTVDDKGTLPLDVPFAPGEKVEVRSEQHGAVVYVYITQLPTGSRQQRRVDLRGTVKTYHAPLEPVAEEDWDVMK